MAPLPDNATEVWYVDYTTGRFEHTFQVRTTNGVSINAVDGAINFVLGILVNVLPTSWRVIATRRRQAGSNLTFPVSLPLTEAFQGANAGAIQPLYTEAREVAWVGRGVDTGRRVELSLYGLLIQAMPDNYRIFADDAQDGWAGDVQEALNAAANVFITIGGDPALWNNYANVNFNSHWEGELRTG